MRRPPPARVHEKLPSRGKSALPLLPLSLSLSLSLLRLAGRLRFHRFAQRPR